MDNEDFRKHGHELVDWMADYFDNVEDYPVKPNIEPGNIFDQLPDIPPQSSESMQDIIKDFKKVIVPGMTHWQHPGFHAYFPGNSSKPSVLAEMLTATLGAQCMLWATSPAAAELEDQMMIWLQDMLGLPVDWAGSIQNGASDATFNAILSARERISQYKINFEGYEHNKFRVYCSEQAHSSTDKAVAMTGVGRNNLIKIPVDENFAMQVDKLEEQIAQDEANGFIPLLVVCAIGTTGSTAIDPLEQITKVTHPKGIWLHIDAALAGSALILEDMRWMSVGIEKADSFVFNPHKWLFTNFDCSAYFVKDKDALIQTFSIDPEYLKTKEDDLVNNYRDWGMPLGRRFRALKLWFVIRSFGVEGLKQKLQLHLTLSQWFKTQVEQHEDFELLAPVPLNTICFRYAPSGYDEAALNEMNNALLEKVNERGKIFITHTKLNGKYTLRMVIGQTEVTQKQIELAWQEILKAARA